MKLFVALCDMYKQIMFGLTWGVKTNISKSKKGLDHRKLQTKNLQQTTFCHMNNTSRFVWMKNQIVIVLISLPFVGGYRIIILACLVVFEVVDLEKETQTIIKARPE